MKQHSCRKQYEINFFKEEVKTDYCKMVCGYCKQVVNAVLGPEDGHENAQTLVYCLICGQSVGYFSCELNKQIGIK